MRTVLAMIVLCSVSPFDGPAEKIIPLEHRTSWVGNSFAGAGENGFGEWVQNGADEIEVTPDGTVFAGVSWDEAGRCAGLYKDGKVNRVLLREHDGKGKETAWGWGTANNALAAWGDYLYIANAGKKLLRFRWKPGELDSAKFVDEVDLGEEAVGLSAREDLIAVVYKKAIETRRTTDLSTSGRFKLEGAKDAAIGADGSLWVLEETKIQHRTVDGASLGSALEGVDLPTSVAIDPKGRLLVCDDGPRQQVLIYDIANEPRLVSTLGDNGGLRSGVPGKVEPRKLFALRGAGADREGNLYVAMGFGGSPSGNLVLRSFTPEGKLRWELISIAFVDTFGFDPDTDGSVIYGRTAIFDLDLSKSESVSQWRLKAFTVDPKNPQEAERLQHGCSVLFRRLQGRRLLYTIGQYGGGYRLFTFNEPDGLVARPSGASRRKERPGLGTSTTTAASGTATHQTGRFTTILLADGPTKASRFTIVTVHEVRLGRRTSSSSEGLFTISLPTRFICSATSRGRRSILGAL